MAECGEIVGSRGSIYPPVVDRKRVDEIVTITNDVSAEIDCEGLGAAITTSKWTINADDDDGTLVLGVDGFAGLVTNVIYSGGTDDTSYRLDNRVVADNGLDLVFTVQVVVAATLKAVA